MFILLYFTPFDEEKNGMQNEIIKSISGMGRRDQQIRE